MGATGGSALDPYYDITYVPGWSPPPPASLPHLPYSPCSYTYFHPCHVDILYVYLYLVFGVSLSVPVCAGSNDFHLIWNRRTLIKNYQGSGYVYDTVIGDYSSIDQNAAITASDILTTSYEEEYIETFSCSMDCAVGAMRAYEE
jgi:hypothetical protein